MEIDGKVRTWAQRIAVGFLCVTATVTFAIAGGQRHQPQQQARSSASSPASAPAGMHEAQADVDVGPGSDEALAASSWGE